MAKRKKFHSECQHLNFGNPCHTCNPNTPRDPALALQGHYGPKVQRKEEKLLKGKKKDGLQKHK